MRHEITITAAALLLLAATPARAQLSRGDLEGLERHREEAKTQQEARRSAPTVQSLDAAAAPPPAWSSQNGTWGFLEEETKAAEPATDVPVRLDISQTTLRERLSVLPEELSIPLNDELEQYVTDYVVRHARYMGFILGKWEYYDSQFRPVFEKQGIPGDITALAIVESAMNPLALSPAGARGVWQFMPETAKRFGMRVDTYVDERLDAMRSAKAAAQYLRHAYDHFGNWPLAIASYNCGRDNVDRAIQRAGTQDYWIVHQFLPKETRGYMPAFLAALYTVNFHKLHDITIKPYTEGTTSSFKIKRQMTFRNLSSLTGIPVKELMRLNPQYQAGIIPESKNGYILRIPAKYTKSFKQNVL